MKRPTKTKYIFLGVFIVGLTAIIWGLLVYLQMRGPGELGNQFQYIGKTSSGCYLICDGLPSESYYFATKLDKDQIIQAMRKARYVIPENIGVNGYASNYQYEYLYFVAKPNDFHLLYYDKKNSALLRKIEGLNQNALPFTIEISDSYFRAVRYALDN